MDTKAKCRVVTIIAGDSRLKTFNRKEKLNTEIYDSTTISIPGANVERVREKVINFIDSVPESTIILVYLAVGINEVTQKIHTERGVALKLAENCNVLNNLIDCKRNIVSCHPNVVVGICTIPVVDLIKANEHFLSIGKQTSPVFPIAKLKEWQFQLKTNLAYVNRRIIVENHNVQSLYDGRQFKMPQMYLHQDIEKHATKWKKGKKLTRTRIPTTALVDGIHIKEEIVQKWYRAFHSNLRSISLMLLYKVQKSTTNTNVV